MRLWRWLTKQFFESRSDYQELGAPLLCVLLPGIDQELIKRAMAGTLPDLTNDESLTAIFEHELPTILQKPVIAELARDVASLDSQLWPERIWLYLESYAALSAFRERVTERFVESAWMQRALTYFESHGIDPAISSLPFYCIPSTRDVTRCREHAQVDLLQSRHGILEALLQQDLYSFRQRAQNLLEATQTSTAPVFAELIVKCDVM